MNKDCNIDININCDMINISMEIPKDDLSDFEVYELINNITKVVMLGHQEQSTPVPQQAQKFDNVVPINHKEHDIAPDKRLPNIIDPKKLKVSRVMTETSSIACPHCKQSMFAIIVANHKPTLFFRDYNSNEFVACDTKDNHDIDELSDKYGISQEYYDVVKDLPKLDDDIAVNDDTEVFCPECHISERFDQWKATAKEINGLGLCPVCGGELSTMALEDDKTVTECESCGFVFDTMEN